jgi:hypothetical protein
MCLSMPPEVAAALRDWVASGGVLLAEARTGLFDARGYNQPELPPYGLTEVFGVVEEEALCSDPNHLPKLNNPKSEPWSEPYHAGPNITTSTSADFRAHGYFVPLKPTTAEVLARSGEHVLATRNYFASGESYYIGTYLGLALYHGDAGALEFFRNLVSEHAEPLVRGHLLRPRLISTKSEGVLAVFNDSRRETRMESFQLPNSIRVAKDVYTGEQVETAGGTLTTEVAPDSVRVFHLVHN